MYMNYFIVSYLSLVEIFWYWLNISSVLVMNSFSKFVYHESHAIHMTRMKYYRAIGNVIAPFAKVCNDLI